MLGCNTLYSAPIKFLAIFLYKGLMILKTWRWIDSDKVAQWVMGIYKSEQFIPFYRTIFKVLQNLLQWKLFCWKTNGIWMFPSHPVTMVWNIRWKLLLRLKNLLNICISKIWLENFLKKTWNKLCSDRSIFHYNTTISIQGMVDGSASKPALKQDTGYMVEKTYLAIAPYLGFFGAYLMPQ